MANLGPLPAVKIIPKLIIPGNLVSNRGSRADDRVLFKAGDNSARLQSYCRRGNNILDVIIFRQLGAIFVDFYFGNIINKMVGIVKINLYVKLTDINQHIVKICHFCV